MSERVAQTIIIIDPIDLIFSTRSFMSVARSSSKITRAGRNRSGYGLKNYYKDSSPLGDRTKYAIKVRCDSNVRCGENMHYDVTWAS